MGVTRRTWLRLCAGLPVLSGMFRSAAAQNTLPDKALTIDEATLTAVVDTIVPADQDPGAVDAGIHRQLLEKINEDRWQYVLYAKGLAMFDAVALERHGRKFADLELEARGDLLISLVRGLQPEYADGRKCFISARSAVLNQFYTSPFGWRVLGYTPPRDGYLD